MSVPIPIALPLSAWTAPSPGFQCVSERINEAIPGSRYKRASRAPPRREILISRVEIVSENVVVSFTVLRQVSHDPG
jgi:hypothetical protein